MKVQARIITANSCAASLNSCDPDDFPQLYRSSQDCGYDSRDIVRVRAFNQHNEKAKQLHAIDVPWARVRSPHWPSYISSTICLSIWTKLTICLKASTRG